MSQHTYNIRDVPKVVLIILGKNPEELTHTELRFWTKTEYDPNTGCLEWTAWTNHGGYGGFWFEGDDEQAHRVCHELYLGPIPSYLEVRHAYCGNSSCVNPVHLTLGTRKENVMDALRHGTHVRGDDRYDGFAPEEVREIRRRVNEEDITHKELANEFDVCQATICRVVNRDTYDHIE